MRWLLLAACSAAAATPPPAVTITNLGAGRFVVDAPDPVKVKSYVTIERRSASGWVTEVRDSVGEFGVRLARCGQPPPACLELSGSVQPTAWTGMSCSSQCNMTCWWNAPARDADYRIVVTSCDGKTTFAGPAFHFEYDATWFERAGLTTDVVEVTATRADGPSRHTESNESVFVDTRDVVPRGKPVTLDAKQRSALADLLRDRNGFSYTHGACTSDHYVKLAIARDVAGHKETIDLAIDFGCNRILASYDGIDHTLESQHLDPSRAAWLALAKQLFPGDKELGPL